MRIIISPAKQMREDRDSLPPRGLPPLLDLARPLAERLREMDYSQLKKLLACNDKLARQNFERIQSMDLDRADTPAILAYDGIQYKYMAPQVLEQAALDYLQEHLFILSGLYGAVRPFDAVTPYRLEMQAKLDCGAEGGLYGYWGDTLARTVTDGDPILLDLSSDEYGRAVYRRLPEGVKRYVCIFGELAEDKVVEKGVYVKMARGEMVRFLAQRQAAAPEECREFRGLGFAFCPERSDGHRMVFLRE